MLNVDILVLNGAARSGKDTFINFLRKHSEFVINHSTVDTIKKFARSFGYQGEKTDEERCLLSDLKNAWTKFNNGPFKEVATLIDAANSFNESNSKRGLIVIQAREPAEIQKIVERYSGSFTMLLERQLSHIPDNDADRNVADFNYDFVIKNNGTFDELRKSAIYILNSIKERRHERN